MCIRDRFKEIPGILEGKAKPDYKTCIEISSQGALKEMRMPAIISIIFPVIAGFLFGPYFVGGLLIGATLSAIMLAIFTGNAGGAWDNGKKYIESGAIEGQGKGSPAHDAAVVGDTVGDPLKDTVGPVSYTHLSAKQYSERQLIRIPFCLTAHLISTSLNEVFTCSMKCVPASS